MNWQRGSSSAFSLIFFLALVVVGEVREAAKAKAKENIAVQIFLRWGAYRDALS